MTAAEPLDPPRRRCKPLAERFWAKVSRPSSPDACWEWTGTRGPDGYGQVARGRRSEGLAAAHRIAYELEVGPIPEGLQLDHLCRNRACVRPDHLEPVTQQENIRRGQGGACWAAKTHCLQGHPYSGENLVRIDGRRRCRTCMRAWSRAHDRRRRAR